MNESESYAMWQLYSSAYSEAVCIQTTYQKLGDALPDIPGICDNHCFMGVVNYIDHHNDEMPPNNGLYPVMHTPIQK
jgi:thioredoxin-related protein